MSFSKPNPPSANTNPNLNPILPIAGVPSQLIQILNDRFREIRLTPTTVTSAAAPAASPGTELLQRTLLLKSTTVGNDIADHVTCYGGGAHTAILVTGTLRKAIAADLTVRINNVSPAGTVVVGSFTIPSATAVDTPVKFTSFTTSALPDLSVFTWDVTASDGSADPAGIASFTIEWNP
jgi:hypothetical protein